MSDRDPLDALFEGSEAAPAKPEPAAQATPEAKPASEPEAEAGQPRDGNGRFAPKAETKPEAPTAEAAPAPVAEIPPVASQKPLTAEDVKGIIEYRHKWQDAETRAAKAEADAKALRERVEQQNAQPIPDYADDPEGHIAALRQGFERQIVATRFDNSEFSARQLHGDDVVQKAMEWGMERSNASQPFAAQYVQQRHPIDWIVKEYKRDQLVSQIGDDVDAWVLKRAAELAAASGQQSPQPSPAASPQPAASAVPAPTPSLASARSAGAMGKVAPAGSPFDAVFPK